MQEQIYSGAQAPSPAGKRFFRAAGGGCDPQFIYQPEELSKISLTAFFQLLERLLKGWSPVAQAGGNILQHDLPTGNCILFVSDRCVTAGQSQGSPEFLFRVLPLVEIEDFHSFVFFAISEQARAVGIN